MMDQYVQESDPVDGVISTIQETYDINETGKCSFEDIIKFMEEYNYLDADKETVQKVLMEFKDRDGMIEYDKAMRHLIQ